MNKRTWIIFAVIVAGLMTALVVASHNANPSIDLSKINENSIQPANNTNGNIADHVFGKTDSKVILIEYGDFQCPGCASAHPRVKALLKSYDKYIAFTFRNFPLTTIHPNARAAAGAAEAAGLDGKYWEMHNMLYENQLKWKDLTGTDRTNAFTDYAVTIGLDKDKFITNLEDNSTNAKISYDQAIGKKIGVDSTPTFYLNGIKLDKDIWSDDIKFAQAIDTELKKAGVTPPTAVTE